MNYVNRSRRNNTEREVQEYFHSIGFSCLSRGWPDFVFRRGGQVVFVEVKRPDQTKIKAWQEEMRGIFGDLGLEYTVCFGMKDGLPDFRGRSPPSFGSTRYLLVKVLEAIWV